MEPTNFNLSSLRDYYSVYGNTSNFEEAEIIIVTNDPDDLQNAQHNGALIGEMGENALLLVQGVAAGEKLDEQVVGMDLPAAVSEIQKFQQSHQHVQGLFQTFTNELVDKSVEGKIIFDEEGAWQDLPKHISNEAKSIFREIESSLEKDGLVAALRKVETLGVVIEKDYKIKESQLLKTTSPERQACFQKAIEEGIKTHGKTIAVMQAKHVNIYSNDNPDGIKEFQTFLATKKFIVFTPKQSLSSQLDLPDLESTSSSSSSNEVIEGIEIPNGLNVEETSRFSSLVKAFTGFLSNNVNTNRLAALTHVVAERALGISRTIATAIVDNNQDVRVTSVIRSEPRRQALTM